jgi:hypothetical protein
MTEDELLQELLGAADDDAVDDDEALLEKMMGDGDEKAEEPAPADAGSADGG